MKKIPEIQSAEFIKGITGTDKILLSGLPQIAFAGRSNAGKSSVINSLASKKNLAKSSSFPGKTTEINFFLINKERYFVDLPGYGFAKTAAKKAEKIRKLILWYLGSGEVRSNLVVLVVDASIPPTQYDREMTDILRKENIFFVIAANKIDKINQSERARNIKNFQSVFGCPIIPYSAKNKTGREELLAVCLH